MIAKLAEKDKAIKLRKRGQSYSEIQKLIPVSKASLSLWLKDIKLGEKYKKKLIRKRYLAQLKGAQARHKQRVESSKKIIAQALSEVGKINPRELKLIGAALYWAEGGKQKETNVSQRVSLSNSDPRMIKLFLIWLKEICKISTQDIKLDLFIHESGNVERAKKFWSNSLKIEEEKFKVYFKKHKVTKRKNVGNTYHGLVRVNVKKSTNLNRKITGWIKGLII